MKIKLQGPYIKENISRENSCIWPPYCLCISPGGGGQWREFVVQAVLKCSVGSGDTDIHKLKPTDLHQTNSGKVSMVWSSKKKNAHFGKIG